MKQRQLPRDVSSNNIIFFFARVHKYTINTYTLYDLHYTACLVAAVDAAVAGITKRCCCCR